MKNFAITGVSGFVAPRHLKAIRETGNTLIAALDPHDSAGILDSYFTNTAFFTQMERFERHLDKLRRTQDARAIDYLSICSPNHLHDAHVRLALHQDADAICEKPLVLNPLNLDLIARLQEETGRSVFSVLQLRHHEKIKEIKAQYLANPKHQTIELTYITSRGKWYDYTWKGDETKSGGLIANIGIHFFDMLIWIFGKPVSEEIHHYEARSCSGFLELENATVSWFLSIDAKHLPMGEFSPNKTYRSIRMNEEEVEFSEGFTDLHTEVYRQILKGKGYGIEEARPSIELVHRLRHANMGKACPKHPFLKKIHS